MTINNTLAGLKPFIRYYGGKWRAAPRYPAPQFDTIVEPFAGAAGYAMRHHTRNVVLVEKYPTLAEMWRYLIGVSADEIRRIPIVESIADLPAWVPSGGRTLVGFSLSAGTTAPRNVLSAGRKKLRAMGRNYEGWSEAQRERCASQVDQIRHWSIIEGDYRDAPDALATWFVDPPYQGRAGDYYKEPARALDFESLGTWCKARRGQVMVCENDGAAWLPFAPFMDAKAFSGRSAEALWYRDACPHPVARAAEARIAERIIAARSGTVAP